MSNKFNMNGIALAVYICVSMYIYYNAIWYTILTMVDTSSAVCIYICMVILLYNNIMTFRL